MEFGFNQPFNKPDKFDLAWFGSRTFNLYYQYELPILKSKFSFVPGIGLSLERYQFKNYHTLQYNVNDSLKMVSPADANYPGIKRSQLITNFIEVPLEFRFSTNPEDPGRSFKFALGGRVGYLYDSFTKVKYREDGETKKIKDKQNFKLSEFRFGVYSKISFGYISLFSYYNLTPLFETGKGPLDKNGNAVDTNNFTFGLSLSSF